MTVLVDTSVWSLALRRVPHQLNAQQRRIVERWSTVISEGQAVLIGPIRQEVLSGIRQKSDFERLLERLAAFDDLPLRTGDYEEAARLFNHCRSRGLTGTPVDLLICAIAQRLSVPIFTTDRDFELYAKHLPIRLHARRISFAHPP